MFCARHPSCYAVCWARRPLPRPYVASRRVRVTRRDGRDGGRERETERAESENCASSRSRLTT
eukprot:scaffold584_cov45-Tisochrysis_lutea.AAC.1